MSYVDFYQKSLQSFTEFIGKEPTVVENKGSIQQMAFEFDNHSVGVEGKSGTEAKIHEIYVFQTGSQNGHDYFSDIFSRLKKEKTLEFVKGIFNDGSVKENSLQLQEFQSLIKNAKKDERTNYAVRYKKGKTYVTVAVLRNRMVFTIDDKNH